MNDATTAPGATVPRFPKAELHLHLDCCVSFGCVKALKPAITLADYRRDFVAPTKCANLTEWLTRSVNIVELIQTPAALRLMTDDVFDQLVRDEVAYAELRFSPPLHTAGGLSSAEVIAAVEEAVVEASKATGVEARLIICTLRHYSAEQSLETAREAARAAAREVVTGFDIAGDEAEFPLDPHVPAFDLARAAGLRITAHAGEALGSDSVWETLRKLVPARIGHGVRAIEDEELITHLRDTGVHLEVCPSSNVQILGSVVPTYADHPVDALMKRGVSLSINSDARTIAAVNLTQEYERLRTAFGWSDTELRECDQAALEAAFLDSPTREALREVFAV